MVEAPAARERERVPITRLLHDLNLMVEATAREGERESPHYAIIAWLELDGGIGGERERERESLLCIQFYYVLDLMVEAAAKERESSVNSILQ
jgi:hypothetical protein